MSLGIPIMIVGATGSGKSTSLRNLDRKTTCYINAEKKHLPFRNPNFALNAIIKTTKHMKIAVERVEKDSKIKLVVVDSLSMYASGPVEKELVKNYGGTNKYEGWSLFKEHIEWLIDFAKNSSKNYIFTCHETMIQDNGSVKNVAKISGSLKGVLEAHFTIVFRSMTIDDLDSPSGIRYVFATNKIPGEHITAKTPMEMFKDLYIENDVKEVFKNIEKFYL